MSHRPAMPTARIFYNGREVPVADFLTDLRDRHDALTLVSRDPVLSDREVIERLLPLANEATQDQKVASFVNFGMGLYLEGLAGLRQDLAEYWSQLPKRNVITQWWDLEDVRKTRKWFRSKLETVLRGSPEEKARLLRSAMDLQHDVVAVPGREWRTNHVEFETRLYPLSIGAACGYALLLLLDKRRMRALRGALARCRLENCAAYFLSTAPAGGGPRPRYCEPAHQQMASKLSGAVRTARWRERRLAKHK